MKLNARQLRNLPVSQAAEQLKEQPRRPIYFILENIYDTYNIGGLFRLGDALNIEKIYLCGTCETPPNHKIKKASIGTDKIVPWEYKDSTANAIVGLRKKTKGKIQIVAVEQTEKSLTYTQAQYHLPLALILGNETFGITPEALALADLAVAIPMYGVNKSLNVIVAAAIVSYWVVNQLETSSGKV